MKRHDSKDGWCEGGRGSGRYYIEEQAVSVCTSEGVWQFRAYGSEGTPSTNVALAFTCQRLHNNIVTGSQDACSQGAVHVLIPPHCWLPSLSV